MPSASATPAWSVPGPMVCWSLRTIVSLAGRRMAPSPAVETTSFSFSIARMSMRWKSPDRHAGFTLLELVVVLTILAVVTTLAMRSIDGLQDEARYDASQRLLQDIEFAVLGSP